MPLINVGLGASERDDLVEAAKEAAQEARTVERPMIVMVFITYNYPKEKYGEALGTVQEIFGEKVPLIGGEVAGFFAKDKAYHVMAKDLLEGKEKGIAERGVGILALSSEYLNVGTGIGIEADKRPQEAGRISILQALDNLEYNPSVAYLAMMKRGVRDIIHVRPISGFLISPSLSPSHGLLEQEILDGIALVTKRAVRLIGGGTVGGSIEGWGGPLESLGARAKPNELENITSEFRLPAPHQFFNGKVYQESVISVVFGSDLEMGYGVATGYRPAGEGIFVTKAKDWTVYECGGRPAAQVMAEIYEKYTGYSQEEFMKDPLKAIADTDYCFGIPEASGGFWWPVSTLKVIDRRYVVTMSKVQEGAALAFLRTNAELIRASNLEAAKTMISDARTGDIGLTIFFTSPGREIMLLKEESEKDAIEVKTIRRIIGDKCPIFGMSGIGITGFHKNSPNMVSLQNVAMLGISNTLVSEV